MKTYIMLSDKINGVRIKLTKTIGGWVRYVSTYDNKWKKTHENLSLDDVMKIKQEVIDNNHRNLYNLITKK